MALGSLHHRDHAVEEGVAFFRSDLDDDAVADDARAASDRAAVTAAFTDDGGGFAGDGSFIHGCNAFDDIAIGRDDVAGFTNDEVAFF